MIIIVNANYELDYTIGRSNKLLIYLDKINSSIISRTYANLYSVVPNNFTNIISIDDTYIAAGKRLFNLKKSYFINYNSNLFNRKRLHVHNDIVSYVRLNKPHGFKIINIEDKYLKLITNLGKKEVWRSECPKITFTVCWT